MNTITASTSLLNLAQLLVCSWRIGAPAATVIPDHPAHALDRALERAVAAGLLPDWGANVLRFADARTGRVCVELPDILSWAETAELIEFSFCDRGYRIFVSPQFAGRMLGRLGVTVEEATRLGEFLAREAMTP